MDPATIAIFGVLASLSVGTIWNQQREFRSIREENRANRVDFTSQLEALDARHAERLGQAETRLQSEVKNLRSEAAENSRAAGAMLFDITKRLGRVEGRLGIGGPPETDDADDDENPESDAA